MSLWKMQSDSKKKMGSQEQDNHGPAPQQGARYGEKFVDGVHVVAAFVCKDS